MEKKFDFTIGLIGNPSVGKTSIFSALTDSNPSIGRTMEKKEGEFVFEGKNIRIVDLPGAYSLTAHNKEEAITSSFVFEEKPDAIIQIVDAQNLERNLMMAVCLMEMEAPLVIAVNLVDLAEAKGISVDCEKLSLLLGVPVVSINGKERKGIEDMLSAAISGRPLGRKSKKIKYGCEVAEEIDRIQKVIAGDAQIPARQRNWMSLRFLEGDKLAENVLEDRPYFGHLCDIREKSIRHLEGVFAKDLNTILTRIRYGFIQGLTKECIDEKDFSQEKNYSEKIDQIALDSFLGVPLFLAIMLAVFQLSFSLSQPVSALIGKFFQTLGEEASFIFSRLGFSDWTSSLFIDGIIGGVGNVLVFVPVLGILFAFIAILEDSGYMARIAYVMDRFMHRLGLHGKAFIPMVLGFGCNVPGIMATRMLEHKRDRLLAILINPFISCGSRLPTYILFAGIFFAGQQGIVILSLYILGMSVAIAAGYIFRKFVFKELSSPFVIELPPYRFPNMKGVLIHSWERVWQFIKNAGTIIMAFSVIVWFMANLPAGAAYGSEESFAGMFGKILSPIFAPLGFGHWQAAVALIFGLAGKEIIVGTFGALYGGGGASAISLSSALQGDFTPLSAYAFMIFVLLYTPCMATLATIKKETGSWKWTGFVALYTFSIAWLAAYAFYNGGKLLGF